MTEESETNEDTKTLLPHHEQQPLCTTRKSYRQGQKLTAVKAYTVTNESNHLLVFGVPSLNLRKEAKTLFLKYGKLLQFTISLLHEGEPFTDTFHAIYDTIESARLAKRMLDTKNFYGGILHVCYAPELESVYETRAKLISRHKDVNKRLRSCNVSEYSESNSSGVSEDVSQDDDKEKNKEKIAKQNEKANTGEKVNMGEINTLYVAQFSNTALDKRKRKLEEDTAAIQKQFKPCFIENEVKHEEDRASRTLEHSDTEVIYSGCSKTEVSNVNPAGSKSRPQSSKLSSDTDKIDVIDFTSTEKETLSNINEALNSNEKKDVVIKKVNRPVNRIIFHFNCDK